MTRAALLAVATGLVAALLAGCSGGSTPSSAPSAPSASDAAATASAVSSAPAFTVTQMTSSDGQPEVLVRPRGPVRGLVVFMHGLGADQNQIAEAPRLQALGDVLIQAGYAVVSSYAHGDNFGNPVSVSDQVRAVADARHKLGSVRQVDIVAFSMGGLDALNVAASHRISGLHALALLSPVTDQRAFGDGALAGRLDDAYGDPGTSRIRADLQHSDPYLQPARTYAAYSLHFWHSPDDHTVPVAQSVGMVRHLASAGIHAGLSPLTGDHGNLTALNPLTVLHLFESSNT